MLKKTETYLLIIKSVLLNTAKVVIYKQNYKIVQENNIQCQR